jgi:hypothetical protein
MKIDIRNHILPTGVLIIIIGLYYYNKDLIGGFVFLTVGGGFLFAGLYSRNRNNRILTNGVKTKAKIVDFVEQRIEDVDGGYRLCHFPIVNFIDRNGIETNQKLDFSDNPKRINKLIDIIYLKKDNEYEIIKDNDWWEENLPIICIIGGFIFSGIGILWLINKI